MRIGLDIDNVILNTDDVLLEAFKREDKNKRNKGIINKDADYFMSGMFDWTKDEVNSFLNENMEILAKNLMPIENAKKYMDLLLEEGHELYLVSNRAYPQYNDAFKTTEENLKKNNINYTKLFLTETNDKSKEVLENNIDIFIDDRASNCMKIMEHGISCILFRTIYERRTFSNLDSVSTWAELYNKIRSYSINEEK